MAGALGFATARESAGTAPINAPLFRALMERMQDDTRRVVLDLGPPRPETVAALRRCRCRLEMAGLTDELDFLNGVTDPDERRAAVDAVLPRRREEAVDVVLCWDLLNYLERPALSALMDQVVQRLRAGSMVHALIAYSTPRMSARPGRIVPTDDYRLLHHSVISEEKPSPRYSPDDLSRCMPGLVVERAMLLKNGMQEFLFRH